MKSINSIFGPKALLLVNEWTKNVNPVAVSQPVMYGEKEASMIFSNAFI